MKKATRDGDDILVIAYQINDYEHVIYSIAPVNIIYTSHYVENKKITSYELVAVGAGTFLLIFLSK